MIGYLKKFFKTIPNNQLFESLLTAPTKGFKLNLVSLSEFRSEKKKKIDHLAVERALLGWSTLGKKGMK